MAFCHPNPKDLCGLPICKVYFHPFFLARTRYYANVRCSLPKEVRADVNITGKDLCDDYVEQLLNTVSAILIKIVGRGSGKRLRQSKIVNTFLVSTVVYI